MAKKSEKAEIHFRIIDIELLNHFENDPKKYKLTKKDIESSEIKVGLELEVDPEEATVTLQPTIVFFYSENKKDIDLFGGKVLYKFEIKNFDLYFSGDEEGKISFLQEFLEQLLGIALAGLRGMFVILNKQSLYKKAYLPLVDPKPFLDQFIDK
jgi:predicted cupin superfamily sugar epimerase